MRSRGCPALWGTAIAACLWLISCASPATPTVEPQGNTPTPSSTPVPVAPTITPTPPDIQAPTVLLGALPSPVSPGAGVKVVASASDDGAVRRMVLSLDGGQVHETAEGSLRYNLDTRTLTEGPHEVLVQAWDAAGNIGQARATFALLAPTATRQPSATATDTATASPAPSATATVAPTPTAEATPMAPVEVFWDELSIATYGYLNAEYTDPAAGHPYPLLHWDQVPGPAPLTYRALILRNACLQLTVLPDLGGRIYQCRYLPTGQDLLYNNGVIKPTHWGPSDQGWWLSAGGIEFCLPVEEHGYLTAEPWSAAVERLPDGGVRLTLSITERSRNLRASAEVTLRPGETGFGLRMAVENPDAVEKRYQYWVNAMLSPGAHGVQTGLRFYYPTSSVLVHSRGDPALPGAGQPMPWPVADGRDLSLYANWRNWLGFFASELRTPCTAVYDPAARIGLARSFAAGEAHGSKLFGFGQSFDPGVYTDDGTQYVEMWGGVTRTFWDSATLAANGRATWEEYWYVLAGLSRLTAANDQAGLALSRDGDALEIEVSSPRRASWELVVLQGTQELARRAGEVRPDAPWHIRLEDVAGNPEGSLTVRVEDSSGREVLACPV